MLNFLQSFNWIKKFCPEAEIINSQNKSLKELENLNFDRLNTDTRTLNKKELFLALKGENFDAHNFLNQLDKETAVIINNKEKTLNKIKELNLIAITVKDTKQALSGLAFEFKNQFNCPLIAVTGSNGKTTVTQLIASILKSYLGENNYLATKGNFNNEIGVPLTLLNLNKNHKLGVLELGMNHVSEIANLAKIVEPKIALINNAQREHQEFMRNVENVAKENGEVLNFVKNNQKDGFAIFPNDEKFSYIWQDLAKKNDLNVLTFGENKDNKNNKKIKIEKAIWQDNYWQLRIKINYKETIDYFETKFYLAGIHNCKNALAVISCTLAVEIPIKNIIEGLENFRPIKGRLNVFEIDYQNNNKNYKINLIDDTYNANPDSVLAAIKVLSQMEGKRLLILGDMAEVGEFGEKFHLEVGEFAKSNKINQIYTFGKLSKFTNKSFNNFDKSLNQNLHFEDINNLIDFLKKDLIKYKSVLIKGSRSSKMERVIEKILEL